MAIQSAFYFTDGTTRTFPSTKHIASSANVAVWMKRVVDDVWELTSYELWTLANNSIVFTVAPQSTVYSQIELRIADESDELTESPSNIALVAGSIANVDTVATNISAVNTVSTNITAVQNTSANATNINTVSTNIANVNNVAIQVIPNLSEILLADDNAATATAQAGIATAQAGISTTKASEAATYASNALTSENNAIAAAQAAGVSADEVGTWTIASPFSVATIGDLSTIDTNKYTTAIVKDLNRGGTFVWSSTGTANGGTVFAGVSGFWNRQYDGAVNVKWFGAVGDGNNANAEVDTAAFESVLLLGNIFIPKGTYRINRKLKAYLNGTEIKTDGKSAVTLKAADIFTDPYLLELGGETRTQYTQGMKVGNFDIDCNNHDLVGIACFGLRDGCQVENMRVKNSIGTHIKTGFNAAPTMNQGLMFINVHAITASDGDEPVSGSVIWDLDGLFESTLIGCKMLSTGTVTNITGFRIGHNDYSRGVELLGCSSANMVGLGSIGIHYSQYAVDCWDDKTTFENISGNAVVFDGSDVSGNSYPSGCKTLNGRYYVAAGTATWDYLVKFGNYARNCVADVPLDTNLKTLQFNGTNQQGNKAYITGAVLPTDLFTTKVNLTSTDNTNYVEFISTYFSTPYVYKFFTGETGDATNRYIDYFPKEHILDYNQYSATETLGKHNKKVLKANDASLMEDLTPAIRKTYAGGSQSFQEDQYFNTSYRILRPSTDNTLSLGSAGYKWSVVYAGTGTINTSDDREKTYIDITEAEKEVALELKANMRKFKFNDAIEKKGEDGARIHFGASAQTVKSIFEKYGLNGFDYAILCYDEWEEQEEVKDEEGNIIEPYRPAGNRYGIRYEELLCFIISAM